VSGPDIFISYSREDRAAARHFAESFTAAGFNVWWDAALRSGETFDEVIESELRAAKAVVVLWSPRSVSSRWVRAEATLAERNNKLVPVIIEACNLPIVFELTHSSDLADWTGDTEDARWQGLLGDLRQLVDVKAEVAPPPPPVEKPAEAKPGQVPPMSDDELLLALERLTKARGKQRADLARADNDHTEFFNWADEYRLSEGDQYHCLRKLDGLEKETVFVVTPTGLNIGRSAPADVIVSGAGVSRSHCLVEFAADQLRVTDLNSTNGTYIDNKRIERSELFPVGSVLRVGNVSFEHEVRPRSEMRSTDVPVDFDDDAPPRGAKVARPSWP
jgi:hypothetical protein